MSKVVTQDPTALEDWELDSANAAGSDDKKKDQGGGGVFNNGGILNITSADLPASTPSTEPATTRR